MARCGATKSNGKPCGAHAITNSRFCFTHAEPRPVAVDHLAQAKQGLSFKSAADVKAFLEHVMSRSLDGSIPSSSAQPLSSMARTLLATFFAQDEDLSQVPDAIKALTSQELAEHMAKAVPTPILRKELESR